MDIEKLIPIVIFIIWVIFAGKKRKKPAKKQPGPLKEKQKRPSNPLFGKFQNTIENFLEQLEQTKGKELPQKHRSSHEEDAKYSSSEQLNDYEETVKTDTTVNADEKTSKVPLQTTPGYSSQNKKSREKINNLKKAVIWSEILAKPVGLREK